MHIYKLRVWELFTQYFSVDCISFCKTKRYAVLHQLFSINFPFLPVLSRSVQYLPQCTREHWNNATDMLVESQQWKYRNDVWNLLDVVSLLLTLNRLRTLFWCFYFDIGKVNASWESKISGKMDERFLY